MSEILTPLVYQIGLGGIGGLAGLILKKLTKLFIIVVGIIVAILLYLGISDVININ